MKIKRKNLSNPKVSKICFAASLRNSEKLVMSLKSLYEHPFFHGILTIHEAKALWKASAKESGNSGVYIWFLLESEDKFEAVILSSDSDYDYDIDYNILSST